jgi:hypothetical protein
LYIYIKEILSLKSVINEDIFKRKSVVVIFFLFAIRTVVNLIIFWQNGQAEAHHMEPLVAIVTGNPILSSTSLTLEANVFINTIVVVT